MPTSLLTSPRLLVRFTSAPTTLMLCGKRSKTKQQLCIPLRISTTACASLPSVTTMGTSFSLGRRSRTLRKFRLRNRSDLHLNLVLTHQPTQSLQRLFHFLWLCQHARKQVPDSLKTPQNICDMKL